MENNLNLFKQFRSPLYKLDEEGNKIQPEQIKKYLLLLYYHEDSEQPIEKNFEILTGREKAYNYIKENIDDIDVLESHILVDTKTLYGAVTIYGFMKHMEKFFEDNDFDIEEYLEHSKFYDPDKPDGFYDKGEIE